MALQSIELQMISKILTTDTPEDVIVLLNFDESYYSIYKPQIQFIFQHNLKYQSIPDTFTFLAQFPDTTLIQVNEPITYLIEEIKKNKQHIIFVETFNTLKDLGTGDVVDVWQYVRKQCDKAELLNANQPLDLIKDAEKRAQQIIEFSKQARIPTGFPEIDKLMYGGLSTVEELLLLLARTNTGKSWVAMKILESAQSNGFNTLYYSPEMQGAFLGTRFDTWRAHFQNSKLHQGNYDEEYNKYIQTLMKDETSAFILEDKDVPSGEVNVHALNTLIQKHRIKLLIVDGISYMSDVQKATVDHIKYKNIFTDLLRSSKQYSCAVVAVMQANRETKESKDEKGLPFPNIYNVEGSDHPARIATQVFAMRQIFEKSVLDIRLEKSRTASNQKPELSYSWDINTGNMQFIPGEEGDLIDTVITPPSNMLRPSGYIPEGMPPPPSVVTGNNIILEDDSDVEF